VFEHLLEVAFKKQQGQCLSDAVSVVGLKMVASCCFERVLLEQLAGKSSER
jgi:hypothetical protein